MITQNFPGNFKSLAPIGSFVVSQAEEVGFSANDLYAIEMAVDEACANIIDHAYGGEGVGDIEVSIKPLDGGIKIILRDTGVPFDPDQVPEPDTCSPLEVRKERGLGVFFMRKLMDDVKFCFSSQRGNTLTLIKYKRN